MGTSLKNFKKRSRKLLPYWHSIALSLIAVLFFLRFYHERFIYQGDTLLNIGAWMRPDLLWNGWDPHAWQYMGWYPIFNLCFPVHAVIVGFLTLTGLSNDFLAVTSAWQLATGIALFTLSFSIFGFFRWLGLRKDGALLGAVIVSYLGFHAHAGLREFDTFYLYSLSAIPLTFTALAIGARQRSHQWSVFAGFIIGLSLLSGTNTPFFQALPFLPFAYLLHGARGYPVESLRSIWKFALAQMSIALTIGLSIGASLIIPSLAYMQHSQRGLHVMNQIIGEGFSPKPLYTLITALYRNWWHDNWKILPPPDLYFHELDSYLSIAVVFLIVVGLVFGKANRYLKIFFGCIGVYCLLLMHLAWLPELVFGPISRALAIFSMRYPYRFFLFLLLPCAYWAASGFQVIFRDPLTKLIRFSAIAGLALSLSAMAVGWFVLVPEADANNPIPSFHQSWALQALFFFLVAGTLFKAESDKTRFNLGRLALFCVCLSILFSRSDTPVSPSFYPNSNLVAQKTLLDRVKKFRDLAPKDSGPWRYLNPPLGDMAAGMNHRLNMFARNLPIDVAFEPMGDPATPLHLQRFFLGVNGNLDSPLFDLYNVRYIRSAHYQGKKLKPLGVDYIYENPNVLDRYFLVPQGFVFENEEGLWNALYKSDRTHFLSHVFFSKEGVGRFTNDQSLIRGNWESSKDASLTLISKSPNYEKVEVHLEKPAYLVSSEVWFPAWRAFVNNSPAEIYRAYGAFRAVELPAGKSVVEFVFQDYWTMLGRAVTVLMLAIIGRILWRRRKQMVQDFRSV